MQNIILPDLWGKKIPFIFGTQGRIIGRVVEYAGNIAAFSAVQ